MESHVRLKVVYFNATQSLQITMAKHHGHAEHNAKMLFDIESISLMRRLRFFTPALRSS